MASSGESNSLARLHRLADEFSLAASREQTAYQKVEPVSAECREARTELYLEAARRLLEDPATIPEIATVLLFDASSAASLDQLADQIGHTFGWWIRDQWRARWKRTILASERAPRGANDATG